MKVLVVDDQRSARRVLRQMLAASEGIEVIEAETEAQALAAIERDAPDLMLLDVRLSPDVRDRGGLDILRKARARGSCRGADPGLVRPVASPGQGEGAGGGRR